MCIHDYRATKSLCIQVFTSGVERVKKAIKKTSAFKTFFIFSSFYLFFVPKRGEKRVVACIGEKYVAA